MTLREAWCRETSACPSGWTVENPALGQCAVTALVIQDILGGDLMRCEVDGVSHYYNICEAGHIDLTAEQFGRPLTRIDMMGAQKRDRAYVLSFPDTARRYDLLRERLGFAVERPVPCTSIQKHWGYVQPAGNSL